MINNLENKLNGTIQINREELFELVNSWGRDLNCILYNQENIKKCEPNQCYPLENLDVSQIEDLSYIFYASNYNGDLSKWDVSSCKDMNTMFSYSEFNNNSISNWNVSNVTNMSFVFCNSMFNGDISSWNLNNDVECVYMFVGNHNFLNKYNNGNQIPKNTNEFLQWFEENREKMKEINNPKEEVLDFFSFDDKKEIGL